MVHCFRLSYSMHKTSSALAMHKSLFYVIISAHARTVSTVDLNDLCAVRSVQQQELPGDMPETDSFSFQGINEHILSIQIVYLNWSVHSRSYMGKSPKLSTIPTWRTPVSVGQLFCWEAGQWFSPSPHLTGKFLGQPGRLWLSVLGQLWYPAIPQLKP